MVVWGQIFSRIVTLCCRGKMFFILRGKTNSTEFVFAKSQYVLHFVLIILKLSCVVNNLGLGGA